MKRLLYLSLLYAAAALLTACYHEKRPEDAHDAVLEQDSTLAGDSMSFYSTHHYSVGYNFIVRDDSIHLIAQQPEEHVSQLLTDTFAIVREQHLAVVDIRIIPQDSIDSVWVCLIAETGQAGWIHETDLLPSVVPTDPISQFIIFFSDTHLLIALIILAVIVVAYTMRTVEKHNAPLVHFRDIPSFYPTLLCIVVASSATFYASLQMFGADIWRHFYYHPSLNPFQMPPILSVFIISVWAMLVIGLAVLLDVRRYLTLRDTALYLLGLLGMCTALYIVFSVSTLYYVGYPLLAAYCWFAVTHYVRHYFSPYVCGHCGKKIKGLGKCPHCGAINE